MSIIYCNIGEMKYYNGIVKDALIGGGSFNDKNIGFEVNNFTNHNGTYFGYVQAPFNTIDITKNFGYPDTAEYAEGITVIWFANHKVIGYYKDASVYRKPLNVPVEYAIDREHGEKSVYNISSHYAVLIPTEKRGFEIVGNGQANIWYGNEIINHAVIEYIEKYENELSVSIIDDSNCALKQYEKEAVIKERVNQSKFRAALLSKYDRKCCLCGVDYENVLIASHIQPWAECTDNKDKLSPNNGLLLCPNHDKLFDSGCISFDDDGKIIISSQLTNENRKLLCVNDNMQIDLPSDSKRFMEYHRINIFK